MVNIAEEQTIVTSSASVVSSEASIMNERLTSFLQILFAVPNYNRDGKVTNLIPATITDDLQEILSSTSKVSEQARMVSNNIKALATDILKEKKLPE